MPIRERERGGARVAVDTGGTGDPRSAHDVDGPTRFAERVEAAVSRTPAAVGATWRRLLATEAGGEPEVRELIEAIAGQGGGKQLRARLACAAYLGSGGDDPETCDALGAAVQLLHSGLCIHDDLIDGDERRHGRPNVFGTVRSSRLADGAGDEVAERQASAAALLAGDLAIGASLRGLASAPLDPGIRSALMIELLSALDDTIAGELLDVRDEQAPPDTARPVRTAELKTASYSVILPLRLGAVACGRADPALLAGLTEYGRHLGVAYQLKDDELAVFGDPARTGKSVSSDIRGGKRTRLLQLALASATPGERRVLERDVGRADLTNAGVDRVRGIMRECGALEQHRAMIVRHAAAAVAALGRSGVPADLAGYLQVVARGVPGRPS
jgi:geranylgeranyl diphosphate synthase, type I